ncbi:phage tail fiber protein [Mesorhizobium sp. M0771]|uniref:phage tail fiber domain-containing protein n=1 Tax=Mesorhizobium sp. M0771 TaxID=2956997 RepID=UPI0033380F11
MANSYVFYPSATGSTTDYSVPFEYLSQTFVKATVNGASVPFTFLSTYMIRFTTAPVGALKIYRQTSKAPVNTYINGSILVDSQLNGSFLQSLHVSEEVADNAMQVATDGSWDATNLKLKNLAAPTVGTDATNKTYVDTRFDADKVQVDASKTAAANSAAAALASQNAAATSATNAATSKTGADTAKAGADTAKAGADTSATNAATSATLAGDWASKAQDVPVTTGKFSALHWAAKAAASAATVLNGLAGWIHGATIKATPADADEIAISDSAGAWALGKVTVASIRAGTIPARLGTVAQTITDWNNALDNGWYMGSNVANAPDTSWWLGNVEAHGSSGWRTQTVHSFTVDGAADTKVWRRAQDNGTWGAWYKLSLSQAEQDSRFLRLAADNALSAGVTQTAVNDGTKSSGTYAVTPVGGNYRKIVNGGAFTLSAPTATGSYNIVIDITNSATAGAVTFSGFSAGFPKGDVLTTTNGVKFKLHISKTDVGVTAILEWVP